MLPPFLGPAYISGYKINNDFWNFPRSNPVISLFSGLWELCTQIWEAPTVTNFGVNPPTMKMGILRNPEIL